MSNVVLASVAIAATVALATVVIFALSRRSTPAAVGTVIGFSAQTGDEPTFGSGEHRPLGDPDDWDSVTLSDLGTAEERLDWAEREGFEERELIVLGNATFLVRWRGRAGRLGETR